MSDRDSANSASDSRLDSDPPNLPLVTAEESLAISAIPERPAEIPGDVVDWGLADSDPEPEPPVASASAPQPEPHTTSVSASQPEATETRGEAEDRIALSLAISESQAEAMAVHPHRAEGADHGPTEERYPGL